MTERWYYFSGGFLLSIFALCPWLAVTTQYERNRHARELAAVKLEAKYDLAWAEYRNAQAEADRLRKEALAIDLQFPPLEYPPRPGRQ